MNERGDGKNMHVLLTAYCEAKQFTLSNQPEFQHQFKK